MTSTSTFKEAKKTPGTELVLANTSSKKQIQNLRTALMEEFAVQRLWLYVYGADNKYEISASNHWGGSLEEEVAVKIQKFAKDFMDNVEPDTDPLPETKDLDIPVDIELS